MKRTVKRDHAFERRNREPIEIPMPGPVGARIEPGAKAYRMGHCLILVGYNPYPVDHGPGWHLSISHPGRYPSWDEIADARYALLPENITMVMVLPPPAEYVNLMGNCFHLHQAPAGFR